jgi:L-lactate dehydrogenase complex protein LldG
MEESTSKEKVLKAVREALISKTDQPFPKVDMEKYVYHPLTEPADVNFAQELKNSGGYFVYCESEEEVVEGLRFLMGDRGWESIFAQEESIIDLLNKGNINWISDHEKLTEAKVNMTGCEALIARLGSVLVSSGQLAGRQIFVFPDIHIILAHTSQIVNDLKEAFTSLKNKYVNSMPSMVTLISGPSRTADIEKTLVMGAHGPKELYVFLLEDRI